MARSGRYRVPHRRRREKKTNYRKRLALLKSGKVRLVVRRSLNYTYGQFVEYHRDGDRTIAAVTSKELLKFGWKGHCGNLPAAYLAGLLLGKKSNVKEAILDIGLQRSTKGNRLYAFLKGVLDSGVNVPHDEEMLPSEDRIMGKHISEDTVKNFEAVKNKVIEWKK
ncbi:MAG: 50S ribosomal protein L18 [Candidatus Aenigmatarchaeota archaeon]|nr:MAG: 50S ribosomal protein L18 [Candidatus Aenigmarchaeota archaeon]